MSKNETPIQRAERVAAELRAASSEAAGVLSDMRAAIREFRDVLPVEANNEVLRRVTPLVMALQDVVNERVHTAEVEITNRFNNTSAQLKALLDDMVTGGHIYDLGMVIADGVKATEQMIEEAQRRNRK